MAAVLEYLTVGAVSSQQLPEYSTCFAFGSSLLLNALNRLEARLEALCDRDESGSVASDVSYEEYVYTARMNSLIASITSSRPHTADASRSGGAAEVRLQHHFNGTW